MKDQSSSPAASGSMSPAASASGQDPSFEVEHFQDDIPGAVEYCTKLIVDIDPVTRAILDFAKPAVSDHIADVGTGLGWLPVKLSMLGYHDIVGVDLSEARIEAARQLAANLGQPVDFRVGTSESLPSNSFDLVLSTCYVHHFPRMSFPLGEIHRILKSKQPRGQPHCQGADIFLIQLVDMRKKSSSNHINSSDLGITG